MKSRRFIAMLIAALVLTVGISYSCQAKKTVGHLKLKGEILHNYKADIYVYEYDAENVEWVKVSSKNNRSNYSMKLDVSKTHRLVFMSEFGPTKVITVIKGEINDYSENLDIDFNNKEKFARLYQKHSRYRILEKRKRLDQLIANLDKQ